MHRNSDQDDYPPSLPFFPGQAANGEFLPLDYGWRNLRAAELAWDAATDAARRTGIDRRRFLHGLGGIAATLAAINLVSCSSDPRDPEAGADALPEGSPSAGRFVVPSPADPDACKQLLGEEFVFDIQTHHVEPEGAWVQNNPATAAAIRMFPNNCGAAEKLDCFNRYHYLRDIFLESDTDVAVLSDTPASTDSIDPLTFAEMRLTRDIIDSLASGGKSSRVLLHSIVTPNIGQLQQQLDLMEARAKAMEVAAWKVYTPYAPNGRTWMLDDPTYGIPMIEKARSLGVKLICAHKGLQLFGFQREYTSPRDIGVVAKAYPDMRFIVYHSGWQSDVREGPYNDANPQGVDVLIKSLQDNGIKPNSNVYAELGTTWRNVMSSPTQAAHVLGKLLKYVGEDNVLWGTDCIWSGSPQVQLIAFRAFQIDAAVRNANGYPELTPELKRKVLGLNSAKVYGIDPEVRRCQIDRDAVEKLRANYREVEPDRYEPRYVSRGPITRRGMFRWFADHGGRWTIG